MFSVDWAPEVALQPLRELKQRSLKKIIMKKVTLITSFALLVLLCLNGCANDSKKVEEKQPANEKVTTILKKSKILKEWLVQQAFKGLPERKCLCYRSLETVEDTSQVTVMFFDTCTKNTNISILYTKILGGEMVFFDRKYPDGKILTLKFYYKADEFSVLGSEVVSGKDSKLLDQQAIVKIVQGGYKI